MRNGRSQHLSAPPGTERRIIPVIVPKLCRISVRLAAAPEPAAIQSDYDNHDPLPFYFSPGYLQ